MTNEKIIEKLKKTDLTQYDNLSDLFEMARIVQDYELNKEIASRSAALVKTGGIKFYELHKKTLLFGAQKDFDFYLRYVEFNREPEKKFYIPRRKIMLPIVQTLQMIEDDLLDLLSISLPPGVGKAQPLYSKILTPNGFVKMGDIKIGDEIISGSGNITKVTGVFPQGIKSIYRVNFDDGSFTECCKEHLWKVQTRDDRKNGRYRVVELQKMLKNINVECGKRKNYSVDYVSPINFKKKKLLLHPYVMGVLIGDGSIASHNLAFTTNDIEMVDKISEKLPIGDVVSKKAKMCYRIRKKDKTIRDKNGFMVKSETQKALEFYEIHNHLSDAKFIPKDYLLSDVEDRIELLRGLLDTDGFAGGYYIEYTTVSKNLAYDIIELVHSLGGYASVSTKHGTYKKNGKITNCKLVYRVVIQFSKGAENPFGLKRKQDNYNPKRNVIKRFIQSVEYVGEKESQCIMVEDPSQLYITDDYIITHNTTLGIFFLSWVMGKHPDEPNLASAHSDTLTRSFFDGVMSIITDPEYLWADVFPGVQISSVNSKDETIDLGKKKRFKTLTCRSIDGSLTGATRCEGVLYADDLVSGIEEALSLGRMDSLWNKYTNDLKSRKKLNCKEIHIATRWSIHDPIGRIQRQYENDPRARFISIPALTDNDESNFNYSGGVGFDTKYFLDMRNILDDVSWKCLFQNEPIEREGLLYNEDELRRYFELPDREPDAIIGICDTKDKGTDYAFLPVAYKYGQDCYIEDCVCDNGLPEIVDVRLTEILIRHKVKSARFESNSAGGRVAEKIQKEVKSKEGITHITTKFTTANKETKIIINSAWVKEHCLFKDRSKYSAQSDYGKMMKMLCSYSVAGKNKNDDAPDGMAMLAEYIQNLEGNFVSVFKRPF